LPQGRGMNAVNMARCSGPLALCLCLLFVLTPGGAWAENRPISPVAGIPQTATQRPETPKENAAWSVEHRGSSSESSGNFLCRFSHDKLSGTMGTVTLPVTDLLNLSLKRAGLVVDTQIAGIKAQAFALHDTTASFTSAADAAGKITGGSVSRDVLGGEKLIVSLTHLDGIRKGAESTTASTVGVIGSAESAQMESRLLGDLLKLKAEYCQTRFTDTASEGSESIRDSAWRTQLSGTWDTLSWGITSSQLGPAFMTASTPSSDMTRSRYNFNSTLKFPSSSVSLNLFQSRDYVDNYELNPMADTRSAAVKYTLSNQGWPTFFTSYSLRTMDYLTEDPDPTRNMTHTITFGTAYEQPKWSITPSCTLKRHDDRSADTDLDSSTYILKLAGGIKPAEGVSLSPLVSFTNTLLESTGVRSYTYQSAISGTVRIVPRHLDLNTTVSRLNSQAEDRSVDTTILYARGRIDWSLDRYIRAQVNKSVSLGGQITKTTDRITETDSKVWDISATVNIGLSPDLVSFGQERTPSYR